MRYADDCNIYVRSERAGQRVMESVTRLHHASDFRLKVNEPRARWPSPRSGSSSASASRAGRRPKRRIAPKAVERFQGAGSGTDGSDAEASAWSR